MIHIVECGDTLQSIASLYNTSIESIIRANKLPSPDLLFCGQVLLIPDEGYNSYEFRHTTQYNVNEAPLLPGRIIYIIEPGDTIAAIAAKFNVSIQSIIEMNRLLRPDLIRPGQRLLIPSE